MADEIIVKVRADLDGFSADMQEAKKIGNSAIQDIEKNAVLSKTAENALELKESLKLIAKEAKNLGVNLNGLNLDNIVDDSIQLKRLLLELKTTQKDFTKGSDGWKLIETIIKSVNIQVANLALETKEVAAANKTVVQQLKEAKKEAQLLTQQFGANSSQAQAAAKRVAELKEVIEDAADAANANKGNGAFIALTKSVQAASGAVSVLQGTIGLMGVESEETQKAILKVQSALAITQGLDALEDAGRAFGQLKAIALDTFKSIRGAIGSTGIGLLVLALGTVVAYWDDIKEAMGGISAEQSRLNRLSNENYKTAKEKLKTLNDQDNVLKLQGKSEKEIRDLKIASLNTAIAEAKVNINNQISTLKSQYEINKRNKEILKGIIEFTSVPLLLILRAVDNVGKLLGKNFGLAEGFKDTLSNFVFDPVGDAKKSIETIKSLESELKNLENTRAGLILENNKKEKQSSKEVKEARQKDFKDYSNTVKTGTQDLIETEKDYADFEAQLDKEEEERAKEIFEKWKAQAEDKAKIEKELIDKQKQQLNELLDFAQNGILLQIGLNPQDVANVRGSVENFIKILNDQAATTEEKWAAGALAAQNAYQTVSNAIFNSDTQRRQEELAALQSQQEEELRLAGDNEQKKDVIRQKYQLKEREIKRRQAEADKRKAIFDATVNTAVAVIKALPNFVLAAIAGGLGAAQIALIAATPIPKFAKGGAVPSSDIEGIINGRPHEAGGVLIEAEGNEFITRKAQAMKGENLGLLEAINMSDSDRDAYINRHYVIPALQAKESQANEFYRHSLIEAENNLIARVSSSTLKSIDRRLVETNNSIKGLAKKDYSW